MFTPFLVMGDYPPAVVVQSMENRVYHRLHSHLSAAYGNYGKEAFPQFPQLPRSPALAEALFFT